MSSEAIYVEQKEILQVTCDSVPQGLTDRAVKVFPVD